MATTSRLLVRNIGPSTTTDTVKRIFGKYGNIRDVHIPQNLNNRGQRFAFIEFDNSNDAESALQVLNNTTIDGYAIYCSSISFRSVSLFDVSMSNQEINILKEMFENKGSSHSLHLLQHHHFHHRRIFTTLIRAKLHTRKVHKGISRKGRFRNQPRSSLQHL